MSDENPREKSSMNIKLSFLGVSSKDIRNNNDISESSNSLNYKLINSTQTPNYNLESIGNKLSDFEEVKKPNGKNPTFEDPFDKYTILGKGNFGYAEKMKSKKDNNYYAIKKLNKKKIDSNKYEKKKFKREIKLMSKLNHENIVKFFGYFEDKENNYKYKEIYKNSKDYKNIQNETNDIDVYCLVLEFIPNGNLDNWNKLKDFIENLIIFY